MILEAFLWRMEEAACDLLFIIVELYCMFTFFLLLLFLSKLLLVCPMKQAPVLVELDGSHRVLPSGGEVG